MRGIGAHPGVVPGTSRCVECNGIVNPTFPDGQRCTCKVMCQLCFQMTDLRELNRPDVMNNPHMVEDVCYPCALGESSMDLEAEWQESMDRHPTSFFIWRQP